MRKQSVRLKLYSVWRRRVPVDSSRIACGNRFWSAANVATNEYTANILNQYTSILRASAPPREISHDLDGNMTQCGDWTYTYDAANRLKTVSSNGVLLVTNFYDAKSRRVKKVTSEATTTFFYDDWNLIEERIAYTNGTSSTIHYYWGKDLSGTLQGAGSVGGLLYLTVDGAIYVPAYDNNGNITRYLDANGNTVAQYTYDAFGNTISKSGPSADFFSLLFSTKYYDSETGLYFYGYRFYSPSLMRWINRDPIEEDGGANLYVFVNNSVIYVVDAFGESSYVIGEQEPMRRNTLTVGTWNTMVAPFGTWAVQSRAKMTAIAGSLFASWPDASRHLNHFLENTGTPLEVRFRNMNLESASAKRHLYSEIDDALRFAEQLAEKDGRFVMVTPTEKSASNADGNWLYAVGEYTTWARASVARCGDAFSMNWHFYFRDIYDWAMGTGKGGGLVTDEEMALLHRYGRAKEYEMNGRHFIHFEWQKGQRMSSGVKTSGL